MEDSWEFLDFIDEDVLFDDLPSTSSVQSSSDSADNNPQKGRLKELRKKRKNENDRKRREMKKHEMEQLRKKIKRMKEEQNSFIRVIEDLELQAKTLVSSGPCTETLDPLVSENENLKEEVEEQRLFVEKIKSMLNVTKTASLDLQQHTEKMERLRIRRKCIEICDKSFIYAIGLLKEAINEIQKEPHLSLWKPKQFVYNGEIGYNVYSQWLPLGVPVERATRVNAYIEHIYPVDMFTMERLLREDVRDETLKPQSEEKFEVLYVDDDIDNQPGPAPRIQVYLIGHKLKDGTKQRSVRCIMKKLTKVRKSVVHSLLEGEEDKEIPCFLCVRANVAEVFKNIESTQELSVNTHMISPISKTQCRVTEIETSPFSPVLAQLLQETSDGNITGEAAKLNLEFYRKIDDVILLHLQNSQTEESINWNL